ncbi:rhodanese-like domain-containing protein [Flavobacterium sp.]|uniref:rhodanese-like domain-containing protein n=1 Tax=Flavobacterium sp. TaxID=239 RepID=UPI00263114A4|nr:rhodanese-like domain-containing protein [Flavobacterium sp.]
MKVQHPILLFLSFLLFSCHAQNQAYENVAPAVFAEKIKATPNAQVIDVRTPEEYASQHLDNAQNINWNGDDFATKAEKLDKTKPVFVYCMVGGRSKKASDKLVDLGFTKVYDLQGGIMKWNAAGLAKPSDKIIGMCSQEYGDLLKADPKVLVNFYADWCEPCKKMAPYIKQMQTDMKGKINIVRLNADENKTLISELKLDELPALLYYEGATLKWKHLGFMSEDELKKQLQ